MVKNLQKAAKSLSELKLSHPGILDQEGFDKHFELHCYKPAASLQPFVTHIWTQRQRVVPTDYHTIEILSGPNIYLFVTPAGAFIHGILPKHFEYDEASDVIAGIKFQPGGFYPFWKQSLSELAGKTVPASVVFPEITASFIANLLASPDTEIVVSLEDLLYKRRPVHNKNIQLINKIMTLIDRDEAPQTVREVAQIVGRSERSLQLLFQKHIGVSLKWVIARKRLLNTTRYIHAHSNSTWTDAAAKQGYSNQSHFTREFKNIVGMSPSQYRKNV